MQCQCFVLVIKIYRVSSLDSAAQRVYAARTRVHMSVCAFRLSTQLFGLSLKWSPSLFNQAAEYSYLIIHIGQHPSPVLLAISIRNSGNHWVQTHSKHTPISRHSSFTVLIITLDFVCDTIKADVMVWKGGWSKADGGGKTNVGVCEMGWRGIMQWHNHEREEDKAVGWKPFFPLSQLYWFIICGIKCGRCPLLLPAWLTTSVKG